MTVLTHADFLNLSIDNDAKSDEGLSEEQMYKSIVDYLNYANIDSDPAESWNLRREAHKGFQRLKTSTESAVRKNGDVGGVIGKFFAASPPPKGSLKEVGQRLTRDLLGAGYSIEKTATTLFTTAAGGIANVPSMVSNPRRVNLLLKAASSYKSSTGFYETKTLNTGLLSRTFPRKVARTLSKR